MTKVTQPKKQTAKTRRPVCKNCKKRFTTSVATAKYCSNKCGATTRNKSKRVDPLVKALKSAFFYYIAGECLRAGTIEILRDHTVESLCELHEVYKNNMKWNGYGDASAYELSHISPVNGTSQLGLLHAENLVSAPKSLNRAHGVKYFGFGKSISRFTIDPKHSVNKAFDKPSSVVEKVIKYLGKDLVQEVVKLCKIKPTQRSQITEWIIDNYNPSDEFHRAALPDLEKVHDLKTRELQYVKAAMKGEEAGDYVSCVAAHPADVMTHELYRLSAYRPELGIYAYALEEALATQGSDYSLFSKHHEQMLFDVLHGKSIAVMADTLEMVIGENTQHFIVSYAPGKQHIVSIPETQRYFLQDHASKVTVTSLASFKASLVRAPLDTTSRATVPDTTFAPMPVFDPWGNEVEAPPF
ncbi:hypothetical protein ACNFCI_03745 [Pseudomonas sp. NY15356]|uniref:hypothetical protein n=1 Tax=unclassified Pseudomonas TaxID=196821 RepID=UPI003A8A1FE5